MQFRAITSNLQRRAASYSPREARPDITGNSAYGDVNIL